MFTGTRREYIPVGSNAAFLVLTVLVNMPVFCTKPAHTALGISQIGTAHQSYCVIRFHGIIRIISCGV